MQKPRDGTPEQQPWQDAQRGKAGRYRISGGKCAQAREKRAPTSEHYGTCVNPVEQITLVVTHFLVEMAARKHQTEKETHHETICVESVNQGVTKQEVQRTSKQVIDRSHDWRVLAETCRTRVQKAEGCDRGAKQYGQFANGSKGDIRADEESDGNARDLTPANALTGRYNCCSPRIMKVTVVPNPIIEDKDMGCEREAAEEKQTWPDHTPPLEAEST